MAARAGVWMLPMALLVAAAAGATTRTVNVTTDENDATCDSSCSLRDALTVAVDGDVIAFALPGSPPWTIRVDNASNGPLSIASVVRINGPGSAELIVSGDFDNDGTGDGRVFDVAVGSPSDPPIVLSRMTVRSGRATSIASPDGGCLINRTYLQLSDVRFETCHAWNGGTSGFTNHRGGEGGAIYNTASGRLEVDLSTFDSNVAGQGDIGPSAMFGAPGGRGGAIATAGDLTVLHSTLSSNTAGLGGLPFADGGAGGGIAVLTGGSLLLQDSTLSGNHSGDGSHQAFGTGADGRGGALDLEGDATLNDVTLSGNRIGTTSSSNDAADGGGLSILAGTTRLRNVTVAGNTANGAGGGVARSGGTLLVRNSILAGNAATGTNEDCTTNLTAGVTSEGYNLVGVADGCASSFVVTGDQTGTSGSPLDAALGALADNGGPTQTRALLAASPAIDGATPSGCDGWDPEFGFDVLLTTDQRGDTRPLDGDSDGTATCDTGAFEAAAGTAVSSTLTVSLAGAGSGSVTSNPAGIDCPGDCSETYSTSQTVALTPTTDPGSAFTGWSGDCTGTGSCSFDMSSDRDVTASFGLLRTLTVVVTGSGTVTSVPGGIDCPGDCSEDYGDGTAVTLTATPVAGFAFAGWSGDCSGTGVCNLTMDQAHSATAVFVTVHTLTVSVVGGGSVTSSPPGISCPGDCTEDYATGTPVGLTATPSSGFVFGGWTGACSGTGTCNVTMSQNRSVTATFVALRTLTVTLSGSGAGSVTSVPGGISCPGDCSEDYVDGTAVTLTATPGSGSAFAGWSGACTGTGTCDLTMSQNRSATATFVVLRTLTVVVTGSGTVTSVPGGINCPGDCTEDYGDGTAVTLTATPITGFAFGGWSGDCSGTGVCNLTMDQAHSTTATFVALHTLTVSVVGGGSVTSSPPGISCPGDCTEDYATGTPVVLTATPSSGFVFGGWSGACSGTGTCNLTMSQNRSVTATFVALRTLTVTLSGTGGGTVTSVPAGISCPGDCTEAYVDGTAVVLTATPDGTSSFRVWSGDCSGGGTCNLTMSADRSVDAEFQAFLIFADGFESGDTSAWSSSVP